MHGPLLVAEETGVALENEARHFESVREALVRDHDGQFALIKGACLEGVFTTFAEAYGAGVRLHGTTAFMVRQITATEAPVVLPALNAGVIFAR
jgi:hypothetical protein